MTSHAAVVARGMGRPCVCGAVPSRSTPRTRRRSKSAEHRSRRATSSPSTAPRASVLVGSVPMVRAAIRAETSATSWAGPTDVRRMKVRANADNPAMPKPQESSARRASASAAPSTCSSTPPHPRVREMILAETRRPPQGARKTPPHAASGFRGHLPHRWPACRSRSACSIRRSTSSFRIPRKTSPASRSSPAFRLS
jgi:pyruvate,orthophosphate dikinase